VLSDCTSISSLSLPHSRVQPIPSSMNTMIPKHRMTEVHHNTPLQTSPKDRKDGRAISRRRFHAPPSSPSPSSSSSPKPSFSSEAHPPAPKPHPTTSCATAAEYRTWPSHPHGALPRCRFVATTQVSAVVKSVLGAINWSTYGGVPPPEALILILITIALPSLVVIGARRPDRRRRQRHRHEIPGVRERRIDAVDRDMLLFTLTISALILSSAYEAGGVELGRRE